MKSYILNRKILRTVFLHFVYFLYRPYDSEKLKKNFIQYVFLGLSYWLKKLIVQAKTDQLATLGYITFNVFSSTLLQQIEELKRKKKIKSSKFHFSQILEKKKNKLN